MPKLKGLSLKQQKFVDAYLGEAAGNGTKAAQLAGYRGSQQTLKAVASENLTKPDIAKQIEKRLRTATMTSEEVLRELSGIASAEFYGPIRLGDKLKALDLIAKHHRLYSESIDVTIEHVDRQELSIILQQALSSVLPDDVISVLEIGTSAPETSS